MKHYAGRGPATGGSGLRRRLESGAFAVTSEVGPPRGADPDDVRRKVAALRGWVDAVNITDNQGANVRMASWAGSLLAIEAAVEPIMQVTCRDRNRIALQSDLLSCSALGVRNVLLMTGDDPRSGDHAGAKPVFDLRSVELLRAARTMRDEGRLLSGRQLRPAPSWLIGATANPGARPERLRDKVEAGAEFVQTQFVFDLAAFVRWMARVRDLGLPERCHVIAGVGPIRSLRALDHLRDSMPGVEIPGHVERRLRGVPETRVEEEGLALCVELIQGVAGVPGVAGVHVMANGYEQGIPDLLLRAGIPPRPGPHRPETDRDVCAH
ncbi:MAG: methylenetetrahydrofolate reductase [Streptosporangiaceae bacterium]